MDIFGTAVTSLQLISDVRKKVKEYKKIFEALDKLQETLIELQELRANVESLPNSDTKIANMLNVLRDQLEKLGIFLKQTQKMRKINIFFRSGSILADIKEFNDKIFKHFETLQGHQLISVQRGVNRTNETLEKHEERQEERHKEQEERQVERLKEQEERQAERLKEQEERQAERRKEQEEREAERHKELLRAIEHSTVTITTHALPPGPGISTQSLYEIHEIPYKELINMTPLHKGSKNSHIFKALHMGRQVAVKVLGSEITQEEDIQRFKKEMRISSSLLAKEVIQFFGACSEPGHLAIVMELMEGNLGEMLKKCSLDWVKKVNIALQIVDGLDFLHNNNMLHRSLCTRNILYEKGEKMKIADFGIAKFTTDPVSHKDGELPKGPPAYLAPELLAISPPPYSTKSDVYAFGMVLWELATHKIPWETCDDDAIFDKIMKRKHPLIPATTAVPSEFVKLMTDCWKKAKERPTLPEIRKRLVDMEKTVEQSAIVAQEKINAIAEEKENSKEKKEKTEKKPKKKIVKKTQNTTKN